MNNEIPSITTGSIEQLSEYLVRLEIKRMSLKQNYRSLERVKFSEEMISECLQELENIEETIIKIKETIDLCKAN